MYADFFKVLRKKICSKLDDSCLSYPRDALVPRVPYKVIKFHVILLASLLHPCNREAKRKLGALTHIESFCHSVDDDISPLPAGSKLESGLD